MYKQILVILSLSISIFGCFAQKVYNINSDIEYQKIDNFGASDAWTFQYLGETYPISVQDKIADLLFSRKMDDSGSPIGIGLSLWRFNIGAGSKENPRNLISNVWRSTDCFMDSTGNYDFKNKQKGQIKFIKAAKDRGCDQFLGFCNSAPWYMTSNKQACNYQRNNRSFNLPDENFGRFSEFLANVWLGLKHTHGITLDYIAPVNEPEWEWTSPGQEGTPCSMEKLSGLIKKISTTFEKKNIKTTILATESGEYTFMYKNDTGNRGVDDQIAKLYDKNSPLYIGDLYGVKPLVSGHSYWTGHKERLESTRKDLWEKASEYGVKLWQSELCIMSNDNEINGGGGRDMSMAVALYVARIMHYDLTVANASAWQWWTAVSPELYKDGLIFIDKNEISGSDKVYVPKLLWAVGNYSRFIRPGAIRVDVKGKMDIDGVMISSYKNTDNTLVTVAINYSDDDKKVIFNTPKIKYSKYYITSNKEKDNLRFVSNVNINNIQDLPSKSIVTFVSKLK